MMGVHENGRRCIPILSYFRRRQSDRTIAREDRPSDRPGCRDGSHKRGRKIVATFMRHQIHLLSQISFLHVCLGHQGD